MHTGQIELAVRSDFASANYNSIDLDLTPVPFTTELVIAPMKAVVGLELNILKILIKGCYMMHQVYRIK